MCWRVGGGGELLMGLFFEEETPCDGDGRSVLVPDQLLRAVRGARYHKIHACRRDILGLWEYLAGRGPGESYSSCICFGYVYPCRTLVYPIPNSSPQYALQPVLAAAMLVICRQYRRSSVHVVYGVTLKWSVS